MEGVEYFCRTLPPTPEWRYLGKPPEKIDKLLAADFNTVYVTTVNDKIYSCFWASPYDTDCWVEVEKVPEILNDRCISPQDTPPQLPSGNATDILSGSKFEEPARPRAAAFGTWACLTPRKLDLLILQFQYCGSFAGNTDYSAFNYYLLDDGTVVQWGFDEFHLVLPTEIAKKLLKNTTTGFLIGMGSGAVFVITVFLVATRRVENKSPKF